MNQDELQPIATRVRELQTRHLTIAGIGALLGVGALGLHAVLGAAEAPIGARIFFCLLGISLAAWQLVLAYRIGRGMAALRAGRVVSWIYVLHAHINGAKVASSLMIGLDDGQRWELPTPNDVDLEATAAALSRQHPRATVGFDAAIESRFLTDPRSLLQK